MVFNKTSQTPEDTACASSTSQISTCAKPLIASRAFSLASRSPRKVTEAPVKTFFIVSVLETKPRPLNSPPINSLNSLIRESFWLVFVSRKQTTRRRLFIISTITARTACPVFMEPRPPVKTNVSKRSPSISKSGLNFLKQYINQQLQS